MSRLMHAVRGFRDNSRGTTITEFGLILLPMMLVLMGSFDLGYQMYVRSQLQGALNDVARLATVETPSLTSTGTTVDARIDAALRDRVNQLVHGRATITIQKASYYEFSRIGAPERLVTDVNGNRLRDPGDCFEDDNRNGTHDTNTARTGIGGADDVVVYQVNLAMPRLLPMAGLLGVSNQYDIRARTSVRNQPFANQPAPPVVC